MRVSVAHEIIGIVMFICSFFLPIFGVVGELFLKKCTPPPTAPCCVRAC